MGGKFKGRKRKSTRAFLGDVLKKVSDPGHILHFLAEQKKDAKGRPIRKNGKPVFELRKTIRVATTGRVQRGRYPGGKKGPVVQVGHSAAFASGAPERFLIEDADLNTMGGRTIESKKSLSRKGGYEIQGVAIESVTAKQYARLGLIDPEVLERAPKIEAPPIGSSGTAGGPVLVPYPPNLEQNDKDFDEEAYKTPDPKSGDLRLGSRASTEVSLRRPVPARRLVFRPKSKGTGRSSRCTPKRGGCSKKASTWASYFGSGYAGLGGQPTKDARGVNTTGVSQKSRGTDISKAKSSLGRAPAEASMPQLPQARIHVPTQKIAKLQLFAKGIMGFGVPLLIGYILDSVNRWIWGDPITKAFKQHIKKLGAVILKAIEKKQGDINHYLRSSPGQTIYAVINVQHVVSFDRVMGEYDDFLGMQFLFVQISMKSYNSSNSVSGRPQTINQTWTGKSRKELRTLLPFYSMTTVTSAISVPISIGGDFYGSWMAGNNQRIGARPHLWAVFTIRLNGTNIEMSGYLLPQDRNFKDLLIELYDVTDDHIEFYVTTPGEKVMKKIYIGTDSNRPGFMHGVWDLLVPPDHPNPDKFNKTGQERWFRPKDPQLQKALSKKMLHRNTVRAKYDEEWQAWKKNTWLRELNESSAQDSRYRTTGWE